MAQATHTQKHNAGRHLAVAEALLQGRSAELQGQRSYVRISGRTARVMVATMGAWQVADIEDWSKGAPEMVIAVDLTEGKPEFYICPGQQFADGVLERHEAWLQGHGGERPNNRTSGHTAIYPEQVQQWKDAWTLLD